MKKNKYNIEFCHIYSNHNFSLDQFKGIQILKKLNNKFDTSLISSVILIDEYNPKIHTLNESKFINKIKENGIKPDFLAHESKLVLFKDIGLSYLSSRERKGVEKFLHKNNKLPCSFLIYLWNLFRLGLLTKNYQDYVLILNKRKLFFSKEIITILPEKYSGVEARAIKYLKSTKFKTYNSNIHHIFY